MDGAPDTRSDSGGSIDGSFSGPETTVRRRRRRRRSHSRRESDRRGQAGLLYFAIASLWGCLTGAGALLIALSLDGEPVRSSPRLLGLLLVGAVVSITGGAIASRAHRDARRRLGPSRGRGS